MSLSYLNIDASLIEQCKLIREIDSTYYAQLLHCATLLLESHPNAVDQVRSCAETTGIAGGKLTKILTAAAALQWECAKLSLKDVTALEGILLQLGLTQDVATAFCQMFHTNRHRINALKGSLGVSEYTFKNISWRLDVELAKRNMSSMSDPKFLIRLDLVNGAACARVNGEAVEERELSLHLQSDYANMKLLQTELQRAVDDMTSVHCQRINKYIS